MHFHLVYFLRKIPSCLQFLSILDIYIYVLFLLVTCEAMIEAKYWHTEIMPIFRSVGIKMLQCRVILTSFGDEFGRREYHCLYPSGLYMQWNLIFLLQFKFLSDDIAIKWNNWAVKRGWECKWKVISFLYLFVAFFFLVLSRNRNSTNSPVIIVCAHCFTGKH